MELSPKDQKRLFDYYRQALFQFGEHDARSVHWVTETNQSVRFDILLSSANFDNTSVLDVGCGMGDLYPLLKNHFTHVSYTGIDILPDFVEIAQKQFPEATFIKGNIFDLPTDKKFDYVLASGALSFKVADNKNYYKAMIAKMYELADKALVFNMLDNSSHIDDDIYAAYNPKEIAAFCQSLCPKIEILTGYLPQDFTIIMKKTS